MPALARERKGVDAELRKCEFWQRQMRTPAPNRDSRSRRFFSGVVLSLAALASSACKKDEISSEPKVRRTAPSATASASPPSASPPPSASAKPGGLPTPQEPVTPPTNDHERKYRDLLGRARRLQKSGDIEGAEQAFIAATGSGQDVYYRAIAELSYFELQQRSQPTTSIEAQFLVASASPEPDVRGQVWFNLATLYRDIGQNEAERAALARSLALNPTAAAQSRLGQRSACVAEISSRIPPTEATIQTGWAGVCGSLALCPDAPTSEAEARKLACLECSGSAAEPDQSHGCAGAPPWRSSYGYQHFRQWTAFIAPAGPGQFFVVVQNVGGWPAVCSSYSDYSVELAGDTIHMTEQFTASSIARGRDTPQADPENGLCWEAPETRTHTFYDVKSAKVLASVQVVDALPVKVTLDAAARKVRLSGGGCDGSVPLDGSNRWVGASR